MTTHYARGARLERLARASLQRHGYAVIRSAGSKGAVNLAAFNPEHILLIQVKAERVTPANRVKLAAFPAPSNALKQFWTRTADGWNIVDVQNTNVPNESAPPETALATHPSPTLSAPGEQPDEN